MVLLRQPYAAMSNTASQLQTLNRLTHNAFILPQFPLADRNEKTSHFALCSLLLFSHCQQNNRSATHLITRIFLLSSEHEPSHNQICQLHCLFFQFLSLISFSPHFAKMSCKDALRALLRVATCGRCGVKRKGRSSGGLGRSCGARRSSCGAGVESRSNGGLASFPPVVNVRSGRTLSSAGVGPSCGVYFGGRSTDVEKSSNSGLASSSAVNVRAVRGRDWNTHGRYPSVCVRARAPDSRAVPRYCTSMELRQAASQQSSEWMVEERPMNGVTVNASTAYFLNNPEPKPQQGSHFAARTLRDGPGRKGKENATKRRQRRG